VRVEYRLVDVFTPAGADSVGWQPCGNPLAVVADGRGVEPAAMQAIAFQLNLSETTFVLPTERAGCDVRVRIFTPRAEMPMAGHPTIGTAFVLGELGRAGERVVFEEGVGPVPVERVAAAGGAAFWRMTQPAPQFAASRDELPRVAAMLGLDPADVDASLPLEIVSTGNPWLVVPLRSLDALGRMRVRVDAWEALDAARLGACPYPFVRTGEGRARARLQAPMFGIAEDPATGSAAGPLGAYWLAHGLLPSSGRLEVVQGVEWGRPSELHVEVEGRGRDVTSVRVGGTSRAVGGGWIDL
jgi:trans-2,3-dihydro-3-hydroxyanthranilate isomerase